MVETRGGMGEGVLLSIGGSGPGSEGGCRACVYVCAFVHAMSCVCACVHANYLNPT